VKKATKRTAKKTAAKAEPAQSAPAAESAVAAPLFAAPVFVAPEADAETKAKPAARRGRGRGAKKVDDDAAETGSESSESSEGSSDDDAVAGETDEQAKRRRRRRGGRGRRRRSDDTEGSDSGNDDDSADDESSDSDSDDDSEGGKRRRRRRRRGADGDLEPSPDDPPNTVVKVREPRGRGRGNNNNDDEVSNVRGSTRLEAKMPGVKFVCWDYLMDGDLWYGVPKGGRPTLIVSEPVVVLHIGDPDKGEKNTISVTVQYEAQPGAQPVERLDISGPNWAKMSREEVKAEADKMRAAGITDDMANDAGKS
jgi:hypothetical protein